MIIELTDVNKSYINGKMETPVLHNISLGIEE